MSGYRGCAALSLTMGWLTKMVRSPRSLGIAAFKNAANASSTMPEIQCPRPRTTSRVFSQGKYSSVSCDKRYAFLTTSRNLSHFSFEYILDQPCLADDNYHCKAISRALVVIGRHTTLL